METYRGRAAAAAGRIFAPVLAFSSFVSLILLGVQSPWRYWVAGILWFLTLLFGAFVTYFFRDPSPTVPTAPGLVVAPGHGKVDVIDELSHSEVLGGPSRRVSIFLSVFDVHVQQAPIGGRVTSVRHTPGQFLNAMRTDCSEKNENVLIGFESAEKPGEKVGIRLIAGLIARRIIPFVAAGEAVGRGGRVSLIQFGSRVDVHLPLDSEIAVRLGERVVGGVTVLARLRRSA